MPELQIDGLPGPTAFHGGLSPGNLASQAHRGVVSRPRAAALQCLAKMRLVAGLGIPQTVLPPLLRPDLDFLRSLGFHGEDASVLEHAARQAPDELLAAMSSAAMWTANAATVVPAAESVDGVGRIAVANLIAMPHRALESAGRREQMQRLLKPAGFEVVGPLPGLPSLADEGAANHHRIACGERSLHLFVHGRSNGLKAVELPRHHPARQTLAASSAVARLLRVRDALHIRQHPDAIDAGAFHNDVVCVGSRERLLIHERAWIDQERILGDLAQRFPGLSVRVVREAELPLGEAVASYLFNGQLLRLRGGGHALLLPRQCASGRAAEVARRLVGEGFIDRYELLDLNESMMNGGGPACLRLRVPMTAAQCDRLPPACLLDDQRIDALARVVEAHYREELRIGDLTDPALIHEARAADDAFRRLLGW